MVVREKVVKKNAKEFPLSFPEEAKKQTEERGETKKQSEVHRSIPHKLGTIAQIYTVSAEKNSNPCLAEVR